MSYRPLFLFVEGLHDKDFFERIITQRLSSFYSHITVKTTSTDIHQVNKLVKTLTHQGSDYWKINDIDESPCVTQKKESVQRKHPTIPTNRILIVRIEIESWYAAGLDAEARTKLKVTFSKPPDEMTKEDFAACIPSRYNNSKIAFMQDILHHFSFDEARTRSTSFNYCMNKLGL